MLRTPLQGVLRRFAHKLDRFFDSRQFLETVGKPQLPAADLDHLAARMNAELAGDVGRPARVRVLDPGRPVKGSRRCHMTWRAVESFGNRAALVEVDLGTGFLHQIRVIFAHRGHAVLGDSLYGDPALDPVPAPRQMLHAAQLVAGPIDAHSPDPGDFADVLAALRATGA